MPTWQDDGFLLDHGVKIFYTILHRQCLTFKLINYLFDFYWSIFFKVFPNLDVNEAGARSTIPLSISTNKNDLRLHPHSPPLSNDVVSTKTNQYKNIINLLLYSIKLGVVKIFKIQSWNKGWIKTTLNITYKRNIYTHIFVRKDK